MQTYIINGIGLDDFLYLVDEAIKDNTNERNPVYVIGSSECIEVQCYDTELGKQYVGAQALAMFVDMRRKQLQDG